jgi:hypothetical protein
MRKQSRKRKITTLNYADSMMKSVVHRLTRIRRLLMHLGSNKLQSKRNNKGKQRGVWMPIPKILVNNSKKLKRRENLTPKKQRMMTSC